MLLELTILLLLVVTIYAYTRKRPPNYAPVPRISFPFLGHFPYFAPYEKVGLHKLFIKWGEECRSAIIGVDFGGYRAVVLNDSKTIKEGFNLMALSGRPHSPAVSMRGGDDGINRGIIWSDGVRWQEQRQFAIRQLTEFGFARTSMQDIILMDALELVANLEREAGSPISTITRFNAAVVNSIWNICTGERFCHDDPKLVALVTAIVQHLQGSKFAILVFLPQLSQFFPKLSGWADYVSAFRVFDRFFRETVDDRATTHKKGDSNDFIDVYLDQMKNCSDSASSFYGDEGLKNLYNSLGDLFLAGSETVGTTMAWFSLYMALHPQIQSEAHAEIDDVLGQHHTPTLDHRKKLPFVEAVIEETLRLSSIVVFGGFHRATEDVTLQGIFIPKDTMVVGNIIAANRDPKVWGNDAEEFNPGRFLSADKTKMVRNELMMAFSPGKRLCIGEALARNQLFLFTVCILQKFIITPDPKSNPTMESSFGGIVAGPVHHSVCFIERK